MTAALDPLATALAAGLARDLGMKPPAEESVPPPTIARHQWRVESITAESVPGANWNVPVRIYRPGTDGGLPVLVYIHGGGWFTGDLDAVDGNCRELCARARCIVVSIGYSLAPAHKFPRALQEVDAVCEWIRANAPAYGWDASRVAIGGESVGANLAAATCLLARSRGHDDAFLLQLLVYPLLNPDLSRPEILRSRDPILSGGLIKAMWRHYTNSEEDFLNPLVAPLRAESLARLPMAMILTAGTDPLKKEGEAFAAALDADGVHVLLRNYEDLFHGFFGLPHPRAEEAMREVVATLGEVFSNSRHI